MIIRMAFETFNYFFSGKFGNSVSKEFNTRLGNSIKFEINRIMEFYYFIYKERLEF